MQENEIKYYIHKEQYLTLRNIFDNMDCKKKVQVNYYYDTKNMD